MECSFCGAKGVKIDLINYGGKAVTICLSCRYLDDIQEDKAGR
jgi:hypothetical protein